MNGNGFVGLTPAEATADLLASMTRTQQAVTNTHLPSTAAERLCDTHRRHVAATAQLANAERELDLATTAVTDATIALAQAKEDLIEDTLGIYYGAHHR